MYGPNLFLRYLVIYKYRDTIWKFIAPVINRLYITYKNFELIQRKIAWFAYETIVVVVLLIVVLVVMGKQ